MYRLAVDSWFNDLCIAWPFRLGIGQIDCQFREAALHVTIPEASWGGPPTAAR